MKKEGLSRNTEATPQDIMTLVVSGSLKQDSCPWYNSKVVTEWLKNLEKDCEKQISFDALKIGYS